MTRKASLPLTLILLASSSLSAQAQEVFNRVASFPMAQNLPDDLDPSTPTSSEIVTASEDGNTLFYSDSPNGGVGIIDITDAAAPVAAGYLVFEGEPTSVAVAGGKLLVGVNTTDDLTAPAGNLAVVDIASSEVETTCDLGGQPDSVAVSPDGSFVAIAIENQRDEELNDGAIPQMPAGFVMIYPLAEGTPDCDAAVQVDMTGITEIAPEDPEPEFVDFNDENEIVVSLQENNHIAIIDAATGEVTGHFPAGSVALEGVDTEDDGALDFTGSVEERPREPDTVKWLPEGRIVAANEGDWNGGTRGFTIYERDGTVSYESGPAFEMEVARLGHYPDGRSDAKGVEPEGLEVGEFGGETHIFVLSERGSVVGVYRDTGGDPELLQILPSGVSPEGAVAIEGRNLLATANETDLVEDGGARSHVMIYERAAGEAAYPQIVSADDEEGRPIGFGALSALAIDPGNAETLYSVSDSAYSAQPRIFTIDAAQTPATITGATLVTRDGAAAKNLDLEGIVADGEGGFWLANEGSEEDEIPHAILRVDADGAITEEIEFPEALLEGQTASGSEGITLVDGVLWIAIQRAWGNDPENHTKLVSYDPESQEWGAVLYPLDAPADGGWVGLSEITVHGEHLYLIERDNQIGEAAAIKQITRVALAGLEAGEIGSDLPIVEKEVVHDLLPDLASQTNGYVVDKVEGLAIAEDGTAFVNTDNDGVDDSSGESLFFRIDALTN